MADISIRRVVGVECDEAGAFTALLVIGTARRSQGFVIRLIEPADAVAVSAVIGAKCGDLAREVEPAAGEQRWAARFEAAHHPALRALRCGPQVRELEIAAYAEQTANSPELARHRCDHIFRDVYAFAAGVLFVHGIGQHERGETLVRFGEPVISFMRKWFEGVTAKWVAALSQDQAWEWFKAVAEGPLAERSDTFRLVAPVHALYQRVRERNPRDSRLGTQALHRARQELDRLKPAIVVGDAALHDAVLTPRLEDPRAPGHARLTVSTMTPGGVVNKTEVLIAESWWTKSIVAPTFSELVRWAVKVVPMTLATHAGARVRRLILQLFTRPTPAHRWSALAQLPLAFLYLVFSLFGALVVQALLLALFVLALPPIPQVRSLVLRLQGALVGSVGQSCALATGPLRLAAMVGQVNHDLRWLCERCRSVMIVAHSQGGAVANFALREERLPQVKELLTVGSGLQKLEMLHQEERVAEYVKSGWSAILSLLLLILLVRGLGAQQLHWSSLAQAVESIQSMMGTAVLLAVLTLWALASVLKLIFGVSMPDAAFWGKVIAGIGTRWTDIYASHDPVPNGPLMDEIEEAREGVPVLASQEIDNFASYVRDHTSYWDNIEQFVAPFAFRIAALAGRPIAELTQRDRACLDAAQRRRHLRVRLLGAARKTIWLIVALFLAFNVELWSSSAAQFLSEGSRAKPLWERTMAAAVLLQPLLYALTAYALALAAWHVWNAIESHVLIARASYQRSSIIAAMFGFMLFWFGQIVAAFQFAPLDRYAAALSPFGAWIAGGAAILAAIALYEKAPRPRELG